MSHATIEMIRAVDRYDPDSPATLKTYVTRRVRGAVIDYQRQINGWRRAENTRGPAYDLAHPLNIDDLQLSGNGTAKRTENKDLIAKIFNYIGSIDQRKSAMSKLDVIQMYYIDGYTMAEIGEVMGVTDSRVSQIITATIAKARKYVKSWKN